MNLLSMLTIMIATTIIVVTVINLRKEYKVKIKPWLCLVEGTLSWWCMGYAMFFAATEKEAAWFWHKISSIGWSNFAAFTAMYFIVYTGQEKKYAAVWKRILFFATPVILLIRNLFEEDTCVTIDLVQSTSGLGWTYISDWKSPWYWFFLLQMIVYFTIAFTELRRYQKKAKFQMKKELAIGFIVLDGTVILIGIVTDFILPHFINYLPPLSVLAIGLFQLGYFGFVHRYDLYNIDNAISSRYILETSTNPILLLDETGEILRCNSATSKILGYDKKYIVGKKLKHFLEKGQYNQEVIKNLFEIKEIYNVETRIRTKSGEIRQVLLSTTIAEDKKNEFLGIIVSMNDVTELFRMHQELEESKEKYKQLADELYRSSYFDQLTQLPNRRKLYEVLSQYKSEYDKKQTGLAITYMDLDGFKNVNDTYGHEAGDRVLIETARKLERAVGKDGFIARMGGDEFICVISDANIERKLQEVIEKISSQFEESMEIDDKKYSVGISIGFSICEEMLNVDELIHKADNEMYLQKRQKRKMEA